MTAAALPATIRTRRRTVYKAVTGDDWSVRAVLSLPVEDLAGDVVISDGLDFSRHAADPWVDLEHGYEPSVGRRPVGWARKSLAVAGSPYAVEHAVLDVPAVGKSRLPIGTTYFDRDDPLSRQVYFLVRKGALPGVSLEFRPVEGFMVSRGKSPLEPRDAYEFAKALVVRWTHCVEPVCPGALTVLKSLPPELDALAKVLRDRRVENESLHPAIEKSLARYQPTTTLAAATPTVGKSMPDAPDSPQTAYDVDGNSADGTDGGADESPANNGVSALLIHAQALADACDQLEADLEHTDSPDLYREGMKLCEQGRAMAEKVKAAGDKHDGKLEAIKGGKDAPADPESEEADMTADDDGTLKAVRPCYKPILKAVRGVKRYSLAEVTKGIDDARAAAIDESRVETPAEALARLRKEDPAAYERLSQKARRNLRLDSLKSA